MSGVAEGVTQSLFEPQPATAPATGTVLEAVSPVAAPAQSRELWAAVQMGQWRGEPDDAQDEAFPAAQAVLVRRAQSFTPRVAVESSDAVLLELAGSQRLFGGLPGLLRALRKAFPRPLQLAVAPTPLAAVLLARGARNCCITSHARLAGRLAALSLRHLHWPEEELGRLRDMGVATLGELLRLPRAGLARRIGPARLLQLDQLTGSRADPRRNLAAPERFSERIDPEFETVHHERLLTALLPALERLEEFLRARQRGVMALRLTLHFRRALPQFCILRCVVPEYRATRFAALLAARLESLALRGPVQRMTLTAGTPRRFIAASGDVWAPGEQGGGGGMAQAPEFLQTLLARCGEDAVHGVAQIDEHRPERQWRRVWLDQLHDPAPRNGAAVAAPAPARRPLALLSEPRPLEISCDVAGRIASLWHDGRALQLASGPERIESGWWDGGEVTRDYYVARAADGALWWIFRERAAPRRWFVHGCFV